MNYKTIDNINFMYFKNNNIFHFQSDNLEKNQLEYGYKFFCDDTFKSCPAFSYQLFITCVYDDIKKSFYTISFTIMSGKRKADYYIVFK